MPGNTSVSKKGSNNQSPTTPTEKAGSLRRNANSPSQLSSTQKKHLSRSQGTSPSTQPPTTRSKSPHIVNSTFEKTPTNRSLLQVSLLNKTGLSPLATSLSESEDNSDGGTTDGKKVKTTKAKCPCNTTSGGKSWYLACSHCGQVWHSMCANLRGTELTQKGIDSLLPQWQCPWCFVTPFPRPKNHKSAKLENSLQTTSYANQISNQVIETLESMVESKLAALTEPTNKLVQTIEEQLSEMTKEISQLRAKEPVFAPAHAPPHLFPPPPPPPPPRVSIEKLDNVKLEHSTKHIEDLVENFITEEEERLLLNLLESESFTREGNRHVTQYGEHYKYMGSKTKPKPLPDAIRAVMEKLNSQFGKKHQESRYHYPLNSCLVNRYQNKNTSLPEHADNEGDIDPKSSILTLSIGAPRHVHFRDVASGDKKSILCNTRSLYEMTRHSQDFFKHCMLSEDESMADGIRYSLTFRAIHWSNFNSTALIGDSNFGQVQFGVGKGKVGQSTPGLRFWSPTIDTIDPLACTAYKNVVLMVGTNDLKNNISDDQIKDFYKNYKTKIALIRKYNKKCRIFVCRVLPTKSHEINRRINIFNKFLVDDLIQCDLNVVLVDGFLKFLDKQTNMLAPSLSRDADDKLHLNGKGVSVLVGLIKDCIFKSRRYNIINSPRLYSNTIRGGPPHPV